MFEDRISTFTKAVQESNLAAEVSDVILRFLSHLEALDRNLEGFGLDNAHSQLAPAIRKCLDGLRNDLALGGNVPLLNWVRSAAVDTHRVGRRFLTDFLDDGRVDWLVDQVGMLWSFAEESNLLLDRFTLEQDHELLLGRIQESAREAATAADNAKRSAGIAGEASLSEHFSKYAESELKSANRFRIAAIGSVLVALAFALAFGPIDTGNWPHLTWRIATVAGAGTLAAYFARQAGQHRRVYNWAKSLEVQLLSFPAFISPLGKEERTEIYRTFARRVLSGPPEKGVETSEDSVGAAQLLDLVTALAKRIN